MKPTSKWGESKSRKPRILKLELKCESAKKAKDAKWGVIEALTEIGYTQRNWKFKIENNP